MKLGVSQAEALGYSTLSEVQKLIGSLEEAEKMVTKHLHAEAYTAAELKEILGQSLETLFAGSEASLLVLKHNNSLVQAAR